jgi:hypothetical protein
VRFENDLSSFDNLCENSLIDFPFHDSASTWLTENKLLYTSLNNYITNNILLEPALKATITDYAFLILFVEKYEAHINLSFT